MCRAYGIFPDKRDPADEPSTTRRVFCGGEYHIPLPNDGRDLDDPQKYRSLFTCVDAESMETRWQVLIDGTRFGPPRPSMAAPPRTSTTPRAAPGTGHDVGEHDACIFFNIGASEGSQRRQVQHLRQFQGAGGGWHTEANKDPATALTAYVPVAKNPHGVNATPDGKYFVCSGKLSPTATVIDLASVLKWFSGELAQTRDTVVAEVELGLGPLHTVFDGRGNAFTTLFLDSQVVKWNVDQAIRFFKGDKNASYVVDRLDVHYQPGHLNASMAETREADGRYLAVGCKFSRTASFLRAATPENEQIIDITGDKMRLLHKRRYDPSRMTSSSSSAISSRPGGVRSG